MLTAVVAAFSLGVIQSGSYTDPTSGFELRCGSYSYYSGGSPPYDDATDQYIVGMELTLPSLDNGVTGRLYVFNSGGSYAHDTWIGYRPENKSLNRESCEVTNTHTTAIGDGLQFYGNDNDKVALVTAASPSAHLTFVIKLESSGGTSYKKLNFDLTRLYLNRDNSIDYRFGYPTPNAEYDDSTSPTPNEAPSRYNFAGWSYKGGLFVGYTKWNDDFSQQARIQLRRDDDGTIPGTEKACFFNVFDLGSPFEIMPTIQALRPLSTDAHLDFTESTLTWENKWSLNPLSNDPPNSWKPTNSNATYEFVNFFMGGGSHRRFCLLDSKEENEQTNRWRYFASSEYAAALPSDAYQRVGKDIAPRVWVISHIDTTEWQGN